MVRLAPRPIKSISSPTSKPYFQATATSAWKNPQRSSFSQAAPAPGFERCKRLQAKDTSKDGMIEASQWAVFTKLEQVQEHGMIAVKLDGEGELPASGVLWKSPK